MQHRRHASTRWRLRPAVTIALCLVALLLLQRRRCGIKSCPLRRMPAHPGGRWTTTAKAPGVPSTGAIGMVSTHRVNEPHRCTCERAAGRSDGLGFPRPARRTRGRAAAALPPSLRIASAGPHCCWPRAAAAALSHLPAAKPPHEAGGDEEGHGAAREARSERDAARLALSDLGRHLKIILGCSEVFCRGRGGLSRRRGAGESCEQVFGVMCGQNEGFGTMYCIEMADARQAPPKSRLMWRSTTWTRRASTRTLKQQRCVPLTDACLLTIPSRDVR
jgi:hypothetical protein